VSGTVLTALVAASLAVGPAAADSVSLRDPKGDAYFGDEWGDVTKLVLRHGRKRVVVTVTLNPKTFWPDFFEGRFDTKPKDPGSEFGFYFGTEYGHSLTLFTGGERVRCSGKRHRDKYGPDGKHTGGRLVVSFPRKCLGAPKKVRLKMSTAQEHAIDDRVGGDRKARWTRWAERG